MKRFFITCAVFLCFFPVFCDYYKTNVTASYYADDFHGKKTSNGEIFNMNALTCAHKMLPFGTIVKVTNVKNGKSVRVRVNDRGPFVRTREIDLSRAAAMNLGMISSGTAKVNLEIIFLGLSTNESLQTAKKACKIAGITYNPNFSNSIKSKRQTSGTKKKESVKSESKMDSGKNMGNALPSISAAALTGENSLWDIQVGAFSSKTNANNLAQKLLKDGFKNVVFQSQKGGSVIRVAIIKVTSENLSSVEKSLASKGYSGYVVKKRSSRG